MKTQNKQNSTMQFPLFWRGLGRGLITLTVLLFSFNSYSQGAGSALDFDGNSYVQIPGSNDFSFGSNDFTISMWFKPLSVVYAENSGFRILLSSIDYTGNSATIPDGSWRIYQHQSQVRLYYGKNGLQSFFSPNILTPNEWQLITLTRESGFLKYYLNGKLVGTPNANTDVIGDLSGLIVAGNSPSGFFPLNNRGCFDELRIWNKALTQTEIQQNMCKKLKGTEAGLVGYYSMDEGIDNTCVGGQDVCDKSGNGNHGTKF